MVSLYRSSSRVALSFVALLTGLLWVSPTLAKGPPDKLTVAGGGLVRPVEIIDLETPSVFDPWERRFIGGDVTAPPALEHTYTVSFQMRRSDGSFSVVYVVRYAPDPAGGRGFLYIPGPADPHYQLNVATILAGDEGRWRHAAAEWEAVLLRGLRAHGVAAPATLPAAGGPPAGAPLIAAALGLTLVGAGAATGVRR